MRNGRRRPRQIHSAQARARSADTPDTAHLAPPKTSSSEHRSRSEPPSPNRQAHIPESSASSSPRPESRGQYETDDDGFETVVDRRLGGYVLEIIKRIPGWRNRLNKETEENDKPIAYSVTLKKRIISLVELMEKGVVESKVPVGWKPYQRAWSIPSEKDLAQRPLCRIEVGLILNIPFHTSSRSQTSRLLKPYEMPTICGVVHTKTRPVIVYELHSDHANCVPMYTNRGKGIGHMSEEQKAEYIAVQNLRNPRGNEWRAENGYRPLKAEKDLITGCSLRKNSYIKFTESVPHYYGMMCGMMGKLDERSIDSLLERVRQGPNVEISRLR